MLKECPFPGGYDLVVGTSGAYVPVRRGVRPELVLHVRMLFPGWRHKLPVCLQLTQGSPPLPSFAHDTERGTRTPPCELDLGSFQHLLIVFGGPQGLEYVLQNDELARKHSCPSELFNR